MKPLVLQICYRCSSFFSIVLCTVFVPAECLRLEEILDPLSVFCLSHYYFLQSYPLFFFFFFFFFVPLFLIDSSLPLLLLSHRFLSICYLPLTNQLLQVSQSSLGPSSPLTARLKPPEPTELPAHYSLPRSSPSLAFGENFYFPPSSYRPSFSFECQRRHNPPVRPLSPQRIHR